MKKNSIQLTLNHRLSSPTFMADTCANESSRRFFLFTCKTKQKETFREALYSGTDIYVKSYPSRQATHGAPKNKQTQARPTGIKNKPRSE